MKGKTVALIRHPAALAEDCRVADILVVPFTVGKRCRGARVIVDRRMLRAAGAHALYIEGLSIRTETVAEARGRRPWIPARPPSSRPKLSSGNAYAGGNPSEAGGDTGLDGNPDK